MSEQKQAPPVVGTLAEYEQAPFRCRREWSKEADVVRITGPDKDHYVASHPELVEEVLIKDNESYKKFEPYKDIFGNGVVAVEGEQWRAQRRELQPFFEVEQVRSYSEKVGKTVTQVADTIEDNQTFDSREVMTDLTLQVMLRALFGESDDDGTITEAADLITTWFRESASPGAVPENIQADYERGREQLVARIEEMIQARKQAEGGNDLLSMLVDVDSENKSNYTDDRIRDEMITFLFGAHETSALMLTYALYLLSDAPKVEERLVAEIGEVLDGDEPRAKHLDDLTYTEQVLNETLRLYSPAHALFREVTTETTLGGYTIPEGDILQLPECVIHRDERWWDNPDEFDPSRFSGSTDRHSFAYFPFGAGPRQCIGEMFARMEGKLALAALFDRFTFERETEEFDLEASLTAVPDRSIELTARARR